MRKKFIHRIVQNTKGFSLLEVLLGVTVFMIGMLGVTALNISSLKSNTFSGNMSEAVIIAGDRLEILMARDFGDASLTEGDHLDGLNPVGRNKMYYVSWNVTDDEPLLKETKTVNVIVEWYIKDVKRTMNMSTIIMNQ